MDKYIKTPQFIREMFDSISKDYDKLNDIMSLGLHKRIKKEIIKKPKKLFTLHPSSFTFLDLCTGTGDIAALVKENFSEAKIIGLDFSEKMLEIAKTKHPQIEFIQGDCTQLPFDNESVDLCTISFGLRNIDFIGENTHENLEKAVSEIYRVLKPGGFFINLDLGKPNPFFNFFLKPYMYIWVAILGKVFHGDETPYKYLARSNETFPSPKELMEIYKKCGFLKSENKDYLFGQISSQFSVK